MSVLTDPFDYDFFGRALLAAVMIGVIRALFAFLRMLGPERASDLGGWLLRIARNGAYNRNQKEQRSHAMATPTASAASRLALMVEGSAIFCILPCWMAAAFQSPSAGRKPLPK